ncbi:MAG TPA: FAD-binding protein, partial [Edaphobacter sp.]|nr:FAD-binding protein [Edaphobacter sp.]
MTHRTNWSGNLTYHTDKLFEPSSVAELQQVVKDNSSIRPLGTRHSFNGLAVRAPVHLALLPVGQPLLV